MKRAIALMLALCMVLALCACGQQTEAPADSNAESEVTTDFPTQPITTIIPKGAGGVTDTLTRSLISYIEQDYKDISFVCENINGASGIVGMTKCALAKPDGYTICLVPAELCQLSNIPSYNCAVTLDDYRYVAVISSVPMMLCVRADGEFDDIYDFIDNYTEDTKIGNAGSLGMGDMAFLAASKTWGKTATSVPYADGDSAAITALAADNPEIDAIVCCPSATLDAQIEAGKIKPICSLGKGTAFDAPVVSELKDGYAVDIDFTTWCCVTVPNDTPDAEYNKLVEIFEKGTTNTQWIEDMAKMYITTASKCGAEAQEYVESQYNFYKDFIAELGIE